MIAKLFTLTALLASMALLHGCGPSTSAGERRPNLILVSFDTLRPDHLSSYGYKRPTSPVVDRLAAEGILFEEATSQSNKTGPSHMTILTGLLPGAHGVRNFDAEDNNSLSEEIPTLATILREHGYRTAAYTAGGHVRAKLGFDQGFEEFHEGGGVKRSFERAADTAEDFAGDPFFLFLHTYEVHDPYTPPEGFNSRWTDPNYAGSVFSSKAALKEAAGEEWGKQHELYWERVDPESAADVQHLRDLYDGSIRYSDKALGTLLDRLAEIGELDNTLIVFLSDHGEEFLEHDGFLHETMYQEVLRVPLIVRPPAGVLDESRGLRLASAARLVDVMPTVLELLALPVPRDTQGRSLLGDVHDPPAPETIPIYSNWPRKFHFALRRGDWKVVELRDPETGDVTKTELYDLAKDPAEKNDVAEQFPDVVANLAREIEKTRSLCEVYLARKEAGVSVPLSDSERQDLQALGYLDDEAD